MAKDRDPSDADFDRTSQEIRSHIIRRGGISLSRYEAPPQTPVGWAYRLGLDLVVTIGVSVFLGIAADEYFDMAPWGLIGMFLIGSAAAFQNVFKLVKRHSERSEQPNAPVVTQSQPSARPQKPRPARSIASGRRPVPTGTGSLLGPRDQIVKGRAKGDETPETDEGQKDGYIDRL